MTNYMKPYPYHENEIEDIPSFKSYQYTQDKLERWINSPEGQYMKKHCLKEYYETVQAIRDNARY